MNKSERIQWVLFYYKFIATRKLKKALEPAFARLS